MQATQNFIEILPTVTLKDQNILENIIEQLIEKNPSVLPLDSKGNIVFVEKQKYQGRKNSGYVDLILKDDTKRIRYTVELMRGELDGDHIVRLINYWDMERRQMPSWTHKAVLVTEHITKFLNVLQAIQYSVPITVIQIVATQKDDKGTHIFFTKLFESVDRVEEEKQAQEENIENQEGKMPASRESWLRDKTTNTQMQICDDILKTLLELKEQNNWDVEFDGLHYTQPYIAIKGNGGNFITLIPDGKKVNFRSKYHKELSDDILNFVKNSESDIILPPEKGIHIKSQLNEKSKEVIKGVITMMYNEKYV